MLPVIGILLLTYELTASPLSSRLYVYTPSVYKLLLSLTFYLCLITRFIQNISLNIQNYKSSLVIKQIITKYMIIV
jgi:hypothetical protein